MVSPTKPYKLYPPVRSFNKYVGGYVMKDVVVDEIVKGLNWKEKIVMYVFTKTIIKVYNIARIRTINELLK